MTKILVSAETERWQTREPYDDGWDQGDYEGRVTNVWAAILEAGDTGFYSWGDSHTKEFPFEVNVGDTLYAVVADYSTGSTFGRDGGPADVLDVFTTRDEAIGLQQAALSSEVNSWTIEYEGESYHKSWEGYFEELNSLDIWEIRVRGSYKDPYSFTANVGYKLGH